MLDGLKNEVDFFEIFGIAKPLKCSQWQLPMVKSNHEMKTDLQLLITAFADFKKHILEVFATLIETNQSNDLRDAKYLHNIITNLQNVRKSKDQIVNHLGNDLKTLKDQLSVNESNIEMHGNTWKPVGSISHKNHIHKTQAETRIGTLKLSIDLLCWLQIYINLIKMIQRKITSIISLIAVLPTTEIIHRRPKDERNRGK